MSGNRVRIERLEVTVPAASGADGRRFGEALARALGSQFSHGVSGRIGRLDIRTSQAAGPAAIARQVSEAIRRGGR